MDDEALLERFSRVTVFKAGGKRAPHKPLLLLIALSRVQRGDGRLAPYAEIKEALEPLLRWLWPSGQAHAHYPFWHLRSDGLWEVPEEMALVAAIAHLKNQRRIPDAILLGEGATGGFPEPLDAHLRAHPALVNQIASRILHEHFPPSLHEDILDAVGMVWTVETGRRRRRDPRFRDAVLRAYGRRCAICAYDGRLGDAPLGLEAAHIQWHAAGGPDVEQNGLALCSFHHKAFDLGAIAVSPEFTVLVSPDISGGARVDEWVRRHAGEGIHGPGDAALRPAAEYLHWHLREVFRNPRALG